MHDAVVEGDVKREEMFITSKLWNDSHALEDVRPALEQTLKDLQLEYLDLYLMHWPVAQRKGTIIPQESEDWIPLKEIPLWTTWSSMEKLYNDGLCKAIGVSNFTAENLSNLIKKTQVVPAVNQVESHPLLSQTDLLEFCRKNNIALTAYAPLGGQKSDGSLLENSIVLAIAQRLQCTPAQVLLAWQMQRDVIVIPKSTHEDRIRENYASLAVELDATDITTLEGLNEGYRFFDGKSFINPVKGYDNIF